MHLPEELHLLEEAARKKIPSRRLELIDRGFTKQANFLLDPAKLKAGLCTRRAGKSYGAATAMFQAALDTPGASVLYIALTRDSAKKIMWKDCIKVINKKFGLGCKFNETELTATLPNGSVLYLTGADAKPEEMEKLLGQKYVLVVIDEGASWKQDLNRLVYEILGPAVADYDGTIMMIGTPGDVTKGLFFDVTTAKEPGWSLHKWSTFDNPYMREKFEAQIARLEAGKPGIRNTPMFKRMYQGEWFIDTEKLVYKFSEDKNVAGELPKREYFYVLGVDLGYDPDPSAFSLCAYSAHDPTLYVVETFKQTKLTVADVAERIRHTLKRFPHCQVVIDAGGGGKQVAESVVEEIRHRYQLPLKSTDAEKTNKVGFIEIMNAEMATSRVKVLAGQAAPLIEEWKALVWDEHAKKRQEHPACENHLADATLYAWRWSYNYAWRPEDHKPKPGSEEASDAWWEKQIEEQERAENAPFWERL